MTPRKEERTSVWAQEVLKDRQNTHSLPQEYATPHPPQPLPGISSLTAVLTVVWKRRLSLGKGFPARKQLGQMLPAPPPAP